MDSILLGLHRAFPYCNYTNGDYQDDIDNLFKLLHIGSFNKALEVSLVLYHIMKVSPQIEARFYRGVYQLMTHPSLSVANPTKLSAFLNLVFKVFHTWSG